MSDTKVRPLVPLLKWPGGKRRLTQFLDPLIPPTFGRYFEPFLGGAALFFSLRPAHAVLSDTNVELINFYRQVRDRPEELIASLEGMENSATYYYRLRSTVPKTGVDRAARMLYLCSLSFNGIYRQNLKGEFNVPYGYRPDRRHFDALSIRSASCALKNTEILTTDFSKAVATAKAGDVIYFDPPYTVTHNNNGFIKYNSKIFSKPDQLRLAKKARKLAEAGCQVIVSNADHPSIRKLYPYPNFKSKTVDRHSVIAASSCHRQPITECIFYSSIKNEP
jgi:DNA adenine methylase